MLGVSIFRRSGARPLPLELREAIGSRHGFDEAACAEFRVVEKRGHFAGRSVTYFRIFSNRLIESLGHEVSRYEDLDKVPESVLFEGHEENDTHAVILNDPPLQGHQA